MPKQEPGFPGMALHGFPEGWQPACCTSGPMSNSAIYDLGEITRPKRAPAKHQSTSTSLAESSALPALGASVAIFVPGGGHFLLHEFQAALFFSTTIGFAAAIGWSLWRCLDVLLPNLGFLGVAPWSVAVAFTAMYVMAAGLHVSSVLDAHAVRLHTCLPRGANPLAAALASALVPGWGQILVGKRIRAGLFLTSVWLLGAGWILALPQTHTTLGRLGLRLPIDPRWMNRRAPIALLVVTGVLWGIAVWDAAASRRRAIL
jgi:hypothetical protein